MSISVGVAGYPESGADADAVLRAADLALFRAKAEGRHRVVAASGEPSPAASRAAPPETAPPPAGDLLEAGIR